MIKDKYKFIDKKNIFIYISRYLENYCVTYKKLWCMKKIFSFKLPVILKPDEGWRHQFNKFGLILIIVLLLMVATIFTHPILLLVAFLLWALWCVLLKCADRVFVFKEKGLKGKIKVFIFKNETSDRYKYHIKIKMGKSVDESLLVDDYEWIKFNDEVGCFIYSVDGVWYLDVLNNEFLGERIGKVMFVHKANGSKHGGYKINILVDGKVRVDYAKHAFYGEDVLFIPESKNLDFDDKDYVLVKKESGYELISAEYRVIHGHCCKTYIMGERFKSAIFVEGKNTVVLVWDFMRHRLKEIYRKPNEVDGFKLIVEKTNKKPKEIKEGVIYQFNLVTKTLRQMYKGSILKIDRDTRHIFVGKGGPYSY